MTVVARTVFGRIVVLAAWGLIASAVCAQQTSTLPKTSRGTFLALTEVQDLWEEERYAEAIPRLEALAVEVRETPYEYALVNQYLAHTNVLSGNTLAARAALEQALGQPDELPVAMKASLDLFYGQILIGEEEYDEAIRHLEAWLVATEIPPLPGQLFYVAYGNYMTGDLPRAQALIERAIEESPEPKDQWYQVYYQTLFEQKAYNEALKVILGLLERNPETDSYWRLLANHFLQLEESREALAAMLVANLQNPMSEPADLRRLVSLYGLVEIPEKAARLLDAYLADESLEKDPQTLRQLGDFWLMARERTKAKAVLEEAAEVAPDGRTYQLLGGIFFEDEDWAKAYTAYTRALDLGGLREPAQVQLLAGISAMRAGMSPEARLALEAAAESEAFRQQAESLLSRL